MWIKELTKKLLLIIKNCNKKNIVIKSYISNKVMVEDYVSISKNCYISNSLKYIGRGTFINENVIVDRCESIGRYCSIAKDVKIGLGSHPTDMVSTSPIFYSKSRRLVKNTTYDNKLIDKPVIIQNDVWIGSNVLILAGVKIKNGAIIAAGSVVTKDVEAYSIVGGVPAKIIKYRFNKSTIENLVKVKWWDFSINSLRENVDMLKSPEKLIDNLERFCYEKK